MSRDEWETIARCFKGSDYWIIREHRPPLHNGDLYRLYENYALPVNTYKPITMADPHHSIFLVTESETITEILKQYEV